MYVGRDYSVLVRFGVMYGDVDFRRASPEDVVVWNGAGVGGTCAGSVSICYDVWGGCGNARSESRPQQRGCEEPYRPSSRRMRESVPSVRVALRPTARVDEATKSRSDNEPSSTAAWSEKGSVEASIVVFLRKINSPGRRHSGRRRNVEQMTVR